MSEWYTHPDVFIRSLATRGSMGGLHPKIIEITDLLKAAKFDTIIIEPLGSDKVKLKLQGWQTQPLLLLFRKPATKCKR